MTTNMNEMVANYLIIKQVSINDPEFVSIYEEAWRKLYPDSAVPPKESYLSQIWASTRTILELGDICQASVNLRIGFVINRLARFHAVRMYKNGRGLISELHNCLVQELRNMGFHKLVVNLDTLIADELHYFSRQDRPELIVRYRVIYSYKERQLLDELYEWLISKFSKNENPQVEGCKKSRFSVLEEECLDRRDKFCVKNKKSRNRRGMPDEIEKKTMRRIQGQLAIDMMMMTRGEVSHEDIQEEEDFALEQFLDACENSIMYKDCTSEHCVDLWNSVLQEDRRLFERGKLIVSVDMSVICTRCLLLAMANTSDNQDVKKEEVIESACEYMKAFQLMCKQEDLKRELSRWMKWYLVDKQVPSSALKLLREQRDIIEDAYSMYIEQSQEEIEQRHYEIKKQVELLHANDRIQYREEQRSKVLQQIREFTCIENGAPLGWLCMVKYGMMYNAEQMYYYLDGIIQKLKVIGLEPFATEKVEKTFYAGEPGTENIVELSGKELQVDKCYRLVQLGWKYQGEIVVCPKAERVLDERGR